MTAPDFAGMTDAKLNEAAALLMGKVIKRRIGESWLGLYDEQRGDYLWSAVDSCDHAAEFSAHFRAEQLKAGRSWNLTIATVTEQNERGMQVERYKVTLFLGMAGPGDGVVCMVKHDSLARALTECTLQAAYGQG